MSKGLCDCGHTHAHCVCPTCPKCGYIDCYCKELSKGQIVVMDKYFITPLSKYKEML